MADAGEATRGGFGRGRYVLCPWTSVYLIFDAITVVKWQDVAICDKARNQASLMHFMYTIASNHTANAFIQERSWNKLQYLSSSMSIEVYSNLIASTHLSLFCTEVTVEVTVDVAADADADVDLPRRRSGSL